jgi:hypothetical protein
MPPNGAQDHAPDEMVEDGIFFIKVIPFCVFLCAIMFLSSYMWPYRTDYDEDVILRRTRKRMRRTFSPGKVHRAIVKTFFHKLSFNA